MALLSIATSASNVDKGLVNVNITVDGFPVTVGVSSVIIHHELNQISYAELVLIGDDKNDSTLSTADDTNLDPGGKLSLKQVLMLQHLRNYFQESLFKTGSNFLNQAC